MNIKKVTTGLAVVLGLGAASASILALGGRDVWQLELLSHFRVQFAAALLISSSIFFLNRRFRWGAVGALFCTYNTYLIIPLFITSGLQVAAGQDVRIMLANIHTSNRQFDLFLSEVREIDPDILIVQEIDFAWKDALRQLYVEYPVSIEEPRQDNFGIACYSKLPIENLRIEYIGKSSVPSIRGKVLDDNISLELIGTHPVPPVSYSYVSSRNSQLQELGRIVKDLNGAVVLVGDLNTTSWSPHFKDLIAHSMLSDSRRGFGIQATWPEGVFLLRVPLDHVLVSKDIAIKNRRVGNSIGSDHRPVIVDLVVPKK